MDFEQKIKKILTIFETGSLENLLKIFDVENTDELKELYDEDREKFMNNFFDNLMCLENYFNPLLIEDREFLNCYNPKVRDYINNRINQGNDKNTDYFEDEKSEFSYKDFTIDDFLTIANILDCPPLPLTRYFFDEENHNNKEQMILKMFSESSYKSSKALKELSKLVINVSFTEEFFKFILSNGKVYNLHKFITDQFEIFQIVRSDQIKLDTENTLIVEALIEFLYTGSFDYYSITENDLLELLEIADFLQIVHLIQIINLIIDETDLKEKRNIERAVIDAERWIKEKISWYFMSYGEELKTTITELLSSDGDDLIENVKNQDIKGIKECLNNIKIKLKEYPAEKNNYINDLENDFKEDEVILSLFRNSYKLPKILKSEFDRIKKNLTKINIFI